MMASTVASRVLADAMGLGGQHSVTFACTLSFTYKGLWPNFQSKGKVLSSPVALCVSKSRGAWAKQDYNPPYGLRERDSDLCPNSQSGILSIETD